MKVRLIGVWEAGNVREASEAEAAACAESAARRSEISGEHSGQAAANSGGIYQPAGAIETRRNRRHHRDVWVGAHSFEGRCTGALGTPEKSQGGQERESQGTAPAHVDRGKERAGNVTLLRRVPATLAQDHYMGDVAGPQAAAIRGLLGRRTGNHGSRKPRCVRSGRKIDRTFHRAAA